MCFTINISSHFPVPSIQTSALSMPFGSVRCNYTFHSPSPSEWCTKSNTDHELFKEWFVRQVFLEHVDVLEDGLDDGVHVPLPVVCQLHRHQHQAEPDNMIWNCFWKSLGGEKPVHESESEYKMKVKVLIQKPGHKSESETWP